MRMASGFTSEPDDSLGSDVLDLGILREGKCVCVCMCMCEYMYACVYMNV